MIFTKKKGTQQAKKQKKQTKETTGRTRHIKYAIPVTWNEDRQCFIDNEEHFILMAKTDGTNLFGLKEEDQNVYMNAFASIFNSNTGSGQIYSYEVPADVDGYINDYNYLKSQLDVVGSEIDQIKYKILDDASIRLEDTSVTRELVDRCFVIILKDKDWFKLERRLADVISCLNSYQRTRLMTPQEMLEVVYNYYNPANGKFVPSVYKDQFGVMECIYPDYIGFYDKGFNQSIVLNDLYCKTKWLAMFYKEPVMALLCYLATARGVDFSLHWSPAPHDAITKDIDKSIRALEKRANNEKDLSKVAKSQKEINENIEMVEKLINDGNFPIYFSVSIRVVASSPDLLEESVKAIDKDVKQFNIKFRDGIHQPLEMFNLTAPICQNYVENYMLETTADTMGYMYPFVYEALYDSTEEIDKDSKEVLYRYPPVYIGNTKNTNGVVFYDNFVRKGDRTNSNEFIVGTTGMGKTLFLMWLIKERYGLGYKQFIIDIEGKELHRLVHVLGGENINCSDGRSGLINPLQIRLNVPESEKDNEKTPLTEIFPLSEHIRFLRSFFDAYKGNAKEDIRLLHDNLIEKALENIYRGIGITYQTSAQIIVDNYKNKDFPIMLDLYNELYRLLEIANSEKTPNIKEITRIKECIAFVEPMACGADASIFNGHTSIDLNSRLICFNVSGLQDNTNNKVLLTQYFNVLSFIWTSIVSNTENIRQQLYNDEFGVIMDPRCLDIMMYFQTIAKRIRKRKGGLTTATQQISDVLKDSVKDQGEAIISQSAYQFYFGLGSGGIKYFKDTESNLIPESEMEFIQFAEMGDCYFKVGSQTAMRIHITLPDDDLEEFERIKADY